ncbi:hypothetical protein [Bacillus dakarensis]|uniref:hypothetical protein n=1 Tax=Robertmurraya dakarensis TaxID=1926278 RepID=UPI000981110C|nr:hypothetical protein [Bacillus dakarensis]
MIFILLIIILLMAIFVNYYVHRLKISTVAGAPIMAIGIVIKGIFTESMAGPVISDLLFYCMMLLTYWIIIHYTFDLYQATFYSSHLEHPILSFSIGTWVAALSVMSVVLSDKDFPFLARTVFTINVFIWLLYFGWMIRNYAAIFRKIKNYIHQIQGGLLLTCVATQSIVIAGSVAYRQGLSASFFKTLFLIGSLLYLLNVGLIVYRYITTRNKDLTESWTNTNCIIHGALSITGVSFTFAFSGMKNAALIIWIISLLLFVLVELIEILRGIQRIKKLGWIKAIFTYSPTQWARVFTFGMFLFFTERIYSGKDSLIDYLQSGVIVSLPTMIIALILMEAVLLIIHLYKTMKDNRRRYVHVPTHKNSRNL